MKVFISWSGELSQKVAEQLKPWLPQVIQRIEPYVSSEDIHSGERWLTNISGELEDSSCGILCLTKDNVSAPWLNFEAGALSKSIEKTRIIPFMFAMKISDLPKTSPLNQFQATGHTENEIFKLVKSLNEGIGEEKLKDNVLQSTFKKWWPDLKANLEELEKKYQSEKKEEKKSVSSEKSEETKTTEILEELLQYSRRQQASTSLVSSSNIEKFKFLEIDFENALQELDIIISNNQSYYSASSAKSVAIGSYQRVHEPAFYPSGMVPYGLGSNANNHLIRRLRDIKDQMKYIILGGVFG